MARRPNILLIMTDQQRWDTLRCLGFEHMATPNIDALARRGVCFRHAFVQGATCAPSRACIVTGQYAHAHGALHNMTWPTQDAPNWIEQLRATGYRTVNVGKMHTAPLRLACGFDSRRIVENKNHHAPRLGAKDDYDLLLEEQGLTRPAIAYDQTIDDWFEQLGTTVWPLDEALFPDNVVGRWTLEALAGHDFDTPLFLWAGFPGPHDPYDVPASALERYPGDGIPDPVGYPGEEWDKPALHRESMRKMGAMRNTAAIWWQHATPEKIRRMRRHYFANVMVIDDWVGRIVQELRRRGQLDNTIVVFTSDHGDALGDHGMIYKFTTHYESVARVPLVWAGPGIAGRGVIEPMVEMIDLGPTLLELANLPPMDPERVHGQSYAALLNGRQDTFRDVVFSGEGQRRFMVRTREWKLVYYPGQTDGELYRICEDPDELRNLYGSEAHRPIRLEMIQRLFDWMVRTRCRPQINLEGLAAQAAGKTRGY